MQLETNVQQHNPLVDIGDGLISISTIIVENEHDPKKELMDEIKSIQSIPAQEEPPRLASYTTLHHSDDDLIVVETKHDSARAEEVVCKVDPDYSPIKETALAKGDERVRILESQIEEFKKQILKSYA